MRPSGGSNECNSGDFSPVEEESGLGVMVGQKGYKIKEVGKVQSHYTRFIPKGPFEEANCEQST